MYSLPFLHRLLTAVTPKSRRVFVPAALHHWELPKPVDTEAKTVIINIRSNAELMLGGGSR